MFVAAGGGEETLQLSHPGGHGAGEPGRDGHRAEPLGEEAAGGADQSEISNWCGCLDGADDVGCASLSPSLERGHDGLTHPEPGLLQTDPGHHGGQRLVLG